jgi:hypothetical protein
MSDNWLILIPESPEFVPSKDARDRALALFRKIAPQADEIKVELSDRPRFIDCGVNLETISCPGCKQELDMEWWNDWMSTEFDEGFPLKPKALPRCGIEGSPNDLVYDWRQGFARFSLKAMNPDIEDLSADVGREFETILGCGIRKIWQHL